MDGKTASSTQPSAVSTTGVGRVGHFRSSGVFPRGFSCRWWVGLPVSILHHLQTRVKSTPPFFFFFQRTRTSKGGRKEGRVCKPYLPASRGHGDGHNSLGLFSHKRRRRLGEAKGTKDTEGTRVSGWGPPVSCPSPSGTLGLRRAGTGRAKRDWCSGSGRRVRDRTIFPVTSRMHSFTTFFTTSQVTEDDDFRTGSPRSRSLTWGVTGALGSRRE